MLGTFKADYPGKTNAQLAKIIGKIQKKWDASQADRLIWRVEVDRLQKFAYNI